MQGAASRGPGIAHRALPGAFLRVGCVMTGTPEQRRQFYLHLVSDATGTTLQGLAKAVLAQFDNIEPIERFWPLTRTERQLERVIGDIADNPGPVLFTLVDQGMR